MSGVGTADAELRNHVAVVGDRDPHRLFCSLSFRRAEHQVTFLDERDSDPRIALVKDGDDSSQQLVGFAALLDEPADLLDRARAHTSRVSPSKERIASLYDSGIATALRSSRSTSTSVWVAVTINSSSRARYAASSYVTLVRPIRAMRT